MNLLVDLSVRQFVEELASSRATPGGGSAAALAASMAAALAGMAAGLSAKKKSCEAYAASLEAISASAHELAASLIELVDADAAAFEEVLAASRLPKVSDEEKAARRAALLVATLLAASVPLTTLRLAAQTSRMLPDLARHASPVCASDVAAGALLAAKIRRGGKGELGALWSSQSPWSTGRVRIALRGGGGLQRPSWRGLPPWWCLPRLPSLLQPVKPFTKALELRLQFLFYFRRLSSSPKKVPEHVGISLLRIGDVPFGVCPVVHAVCCLRNRGEHKAEIQVRPDEIKKCLVGFVPDSQAFGTARGFRAKSPCSSGPAS